MSFPNSDWPQTKWYASDEVAHWLGVRHIDLYRSFLRMTDEWPEVFDSGVEFSTSKPVNSGASFASLLMTGAALAAFLYWRKHHGKPEAIFRRCGFRINRSKSENLETMQ